MSSLLADSTIFGEADARNRTEIEGLRDYFLEVPDFKSIVLGRKTLIIGRKGTGKTAIRTRIAQFRNEVRHFDLSQPPPRHHAVFQHYAKLVENGEGVGVSAYEVGWRAIILAQVLFELSEVGLIRLQETARIRKFLAGIGVADPDKMASRVRDITLGFNAMLTASVSINPAELTIRLPSEPELAVLTKLILNVAERIAETFMIVVDRVDRELDRPLVGSGYMQHLSYINGLCAAIARFNSDVNSQFLRVYALVREDLYNQLALRFHNVTEFEGVAYHLRWTPLELMDLLGLRMARAAGSRYELVKSHDGRRREFETFLYRFFDKQKYDSLPLWTYLLSHTHLRPRDLIQLCNCSRIVAVHDQCYRIDGHAINSGGQDYSRRRYEDLISESAYRVVNFKGLIDVFRERPLRWERGPLLAHLSVAIPAQGIVDLATAGESPFTAEKALQYLYDVGFLIVPVTARDARSSQLSSQLPFISSVNEPHYPVLTANRLGVHPAFIRELTRDRGYDQNILDVIQL